MYKTVRLHIPKQYSNPTNAQIEAHLIEEPPDEGPDRSRERSQRKFSPPRLSSTQVHSSPPPAYGSGEGLNVFVFGQKRWLEAVGRRGKFGLNSAWGPNPELLKWFPGRWVKVCAPIHDAKNWCIASCAGVYRRMI